MATFNVEMRQRVSGSFSDIIYPKAHWANIDGKPSTFTPTAHTHDIDDINATGTPSANTYLRGDGAWATPEGGSSGGSEVIIDYLSTARASSLVFTGISLAKGKVYKMFLSLKGVSNGAAININLNDMIISSATKQRTHSNGTTLAGTVETYNQGSFSLSLSNASRKTVIECTLFLDYEGSIHYLGNTNGETSDTTMGISQFGGIIRNTNNDPVTKITLNSNFANQYDTGTIFKLWEVA